MGAISMESNVTRDEDICIYFWMGYCHLVFSLEVHICIIALIRREHDASLKRCKRNDSRRRQKWTKPAIGPRIKQFRQWHYHDIGGKLSDLERLNAPARQMIPNRIEQMLSHEPCL
jgi:hypothetical protein